MMLPKNWFLAALLGLGLVGCADTETTMLGPVRPAIMPDAVRLYTVPPRHFEQIAIINSSGGTSWLFPDRAAMDTALGHLRAEAAALGANGLLLQEVYDQPAGGLSLGVGGFGFGAGNHNFYAGGGDVGVGGPLINRRVRALAIYVPGRRG